MLAIELDAQAPHVGDCRREGLVLIEDATDEGYFDVHAFTARARSIAVSAGDATTAQTAACAGELTMRHRRGRDVLTQSPEPGGREA